MYFYKKSQILKIRVSLFYNFANLFNIWLKTLLASQICSALNLLQNVVFIEVCKESPASYRYIIEQVKMILIAFSHNWEYCFLILHSNLTSGKLIQISYNAYSETVSVNYSYPVSLKSTGLCCTLTFYLWIIVQWSFGKYAFIELCRSLNFWHFYTIFKKPY